MRKKLKKLLTYVLSVAMMIGVMSFSLQHINVEAAGNAALPYATIPVISESSGNYMDTESLFVEITSPDGGEIYYTLDGTNPTIASIKYVSAIEIPTDNTDITLKAIAIADGMQDSQIASETYYFTHNESTNWNKDENNHWHECIKGDGYVFEDSKTTHSYDEGVVTIQENRDVGAYGQKKYTCTICSYEKYEIYHTHTQIGRWDSDSESHWRYCRMCPLKMEEAEHTVADWTVTQEATETEQGSRYGVCEVCGYRVEQVIPEKEHVHTGASEWNKDENNHWHECIKGDGYVFEDSKTPHSYDEGVVTIQENRDVGAFGQKKYTCTICSYEKFEIYHTHTQIGRWDNDSESHWRYCRMCPLKMEEAEHTVADWTVTQEATETEQGSRYGACEVCGYKVEQVIPEKEHVHTGASEWNKDENNHWHECTKGDGYKMDEAKHIFTDWTVTQEATETKQGSRYRACEVCGYKVEQVIPEKEHVHTGASEWNKDENNHWHECTKGDGYKMDETKHTFTDWTVKQEATETEQGSRYRTCEVCGYKDEQAIPEKEHVHVESSEWNKDSENHWHECTKGDKYVFEKSKAPHGYSDDEDTTCDTCGYVRTVTLDLEPTGEYTVINGGESTFTIDKDKELVIRGDGAYSKFKEINVDGVVVNPSDYNVTEGSTIITLKADYLKGLTEGEHSIELVWTDGSAKTSFTVQKTADENTPPKKDEVPKTGDNSPIAWLFVLMMVSGGTAICLERKKKYLDK